MSCNKKYKYPFEWMLRSFLGKYTMNSSRQIKLGAVLSYISVALNLLAGLLYTPWMVAAIGKSQYGLFTLANSVITLFLVDFGLSSATTRFLSKYNAEGDIAGAEHFLGAVYKLYLMIDGVILVILTGIFFGIDRIFVNLTPTELEQFKVVFIISAIFSVVNFPLVTFNGILTAYEKFVPLKIADLLYRVLNVGLTVAALLMGYGLYALVSLHAIAGLAALVFKFVVIRKTVPVKVKFKGTQKEIYREVFGFSVWVTISSLATRLVFNVTPSILGIVANSAAIAVFGIIATIESYSYSITTAINGMFLPRISRMVARKESDQNLTPLLINVGRFQYFVNGAIVAVFAAVGRDFICLWMDETYLTAYYGILLVLFPGLFYNSLEIANSAIIVTGKVKHMAIINLITGIINVILSIPLSKALGEIGACASIWFAYMVRSVICHIVYHRELPLSIPEFMKECYVKMSPPILVTIICGVALNYCLPGSGWILFLVKGAVAAFIYIISAACFGLTKQERQRIMGSLKK